MMLRRLPILLVLALAPLAAAATPSASQQPVVAHPPKPKVTTLGVTKYASLVSYCWHTDGKGTCADGVGGSPKSTIAWRAGREVRIDFRLPVHEVSVQTVHIAKLGAPSTGEVKLRVKRLDKAGRRYLVRIAARSKGANELVMFARFVEQGDVFAELGLRRLR
jgi:hypothetical protein